MQWRIENFGIRRTGGYGLGLGRADNFFHFVSFRNTGNELLRNVNIDDFE